MDSVELGQMLGYKVELTNQQERGPIKQGTYDIDLGLEPGSKIGVLGENWLHG